MTERITPRQFHEAAGVEDWRVIGEGTCTYFPTGSFAAAPGSCRRSANCPVSMIITPMSTCGSRA